MVVFFDNFSNIFKESVDNMNTLKIKQACECLEVSKFYKCTGVTGGDGVSSTMNLN